MMSARKEASVLDDLQIADPRGAGDACAQRGRPAAGQDPAKRDQILEGAWRVFERMGFDAASMNDITREAGVSKGTIYVYFSSKEELFEALVEKYRAKFIAGILEALNPDAPLREAMTTYGERLVKKVTSHMAISGQRVVVGVTERMPEIGQQFYRKGPCRGLDLFSEFLAKHVARGNLAVPDTALAADQFASLCQAGIFRRRLFGDMMDEPSDEQIRHTVASAVDMFLKAYGRGEAGTGK